MIPLWLALMAVVVGLCTILWLILSHVEEGLPDVRIDEAYAEQVRRADVDRAFQAKGGKLLRADFNRQF